MHMADALISPAVGGLMAAAAIGAGAVSVSKVKNDIEDKKIPLMGVMGAFIFAAQMINISIPGTGSSGHIGGGLLLAALLGPHAGFLAMASMLIIQALFFADGGLLALGCNIINLGFFTCYVAYPLIFKPLLRLSGKNNKKTVIFASVVASVAGLQLGSLGVVFETLLSGRLDLPHVTFLALMQGIHLAIGLIEGLITGAVVSFVYKNRPDILEDVSSDSVQRKVSYRKLIACVVIATVLVGGFLSWFASEHPDGLEWALERTLKSEINESGSVHESAADLQGKTAIMPDYSFKDSKLGSAEQTSIAGLLGGTMTLLFTGLMGLSVYLVKKRKGLSDK